MNRIKKRTYFMGNILILNYHNIVADEQEVAANSKVKDKRTIRKKTLIKQLDLIQANNIPIVGLNPSIKTQCTELNNGNSHAQFGIALTFCGGFKSDVEIVLPLLKARGLTASFFPTLSALNAPGGLTWKDLNKLRDN
jgi:peptidoglycan/xylan/chitin deacetylase (PgdA/CDA1 family)